MIIFDSAPTPAGAALTLNAATVTGALTTVTTAQQTPFNVGLVVVVSGYAAGGSTTGFNVLVQSASTTTGTFVSGTARINQITADGTYTLPVAAADFRSLQVLLQRNDGAPTATVTCYWLWDTATESFNNTALLNWTRVLLASNAIASAQTVDFQPSKYGSGEASAMRFVFTSTVTAGTVSVQLYGSADGTTYWEMPQSTAGGPQSVNGDAQLVLSATGVASLALGGVVPPYLRAILTPAGFTGTVAVEAASTAFLIP